MEEGNKPDQTESQLAIIDPLQESGMLQVFGKEADPFEVHSFNMADQNESLLYVNAVGGEAESLSDVKEEEIEIAYYYAKPIQFQAGKNDTRYAEGEVINAVRMVLVAPDGKQYYTTSPTAMKVIGAIHRTPLGKKRFNPPIRFRLGEVQTRQGWKTLTLSLIPPEKKQP